jgi:hypothetical protein
MSTEVELAQLVGRRADRRLLERDSGALPASLGTPPPAAAVGPARRRLTLLGATFTGASLLGGIALVVVAVVALIAGAPIGLVAGALVVGLLLAGTHWGWAHVAEVTADSLERRTQQDAEALRERWLESVEPYTRHEVATEVDEDGSIEILSYVYRPVAVGESAFDFEREVVARERHSGDEPGAQVAERAELLRRQAAAQTARQRALYEATAAAYHAALLSRDDERSRVQARRAAAQALSEAINRNLREPPLIE